MKPKYAMVHADQNKIYVNKGWKINPPMTGLFNWVNVFGGDFLNIMEPTDEYDVLHVNLCGSTTNYVSILKDRHPDKIVVANLDYDVALLPKYGGIEPYVKAMQEADFIFVPSRQQRDGLQHLISKPVHMISHPCDVDALAGFRIRVDDRTGIGIYAHSKYEQSVDVGIPNLIPFLGREDIHMYGGGGGVNLKYVNANYSAMAFSQYIDSIHHRKVMIDTHLDLAAGRLQQDCAALGIPVVGAPNVENQIDFFPETTGGHFSDHSTMTDMVERLLSDPGFYVRVSERAMDAVRLQDLRHSREAFLGMIRWEVEE